MIPQPILNTDPDLKLNVAVTLENLQRLLVSTYSTTIDQEMPTIGSEILNSNAAVVVSRAQNWPLGIVTEGLVHRQPPSLRAIQSPDSEDFPRTPGFGA